LHFNTIPYAPTTYHFCHFLLSFIHVSLGCITVVLCTQMRPIVTDREACLSVCLTVTLVSPAKTSEPIEMPFGSNILVGPGNHVLDGGPDPHEKGQLWGKGTSHCKYRDTLRSSAKTAKPIEMLFGLWARMGPRNHVLEGVHRC